MLVDLNILIRPCEEVYGPSDDTWLLINALEVIRDERVLEMGCGTGVVSLHMAKMGAKVTCVDINPRAVECTKWNASRNDLLVNAMESDLFQMVPGTFDLMVFNPPYLRGTSEHMQDLSWAGGPTGTETLHRFLEQTEGHLADGGRLVVVVSSLMHQGALDKVLKGFQVRELASMRLFFEELKVLELKVSEIGPRRPRSYF
jgi:release factor glutamine methyltransferase